MNNVNMVKAVRVENVVVNPSYKVDEKGDDLFFVGEVGREREALVFGLGKAKRLLQAINDDPETFIDQLVEYVHRREGKIIAARTPCKTLEYNGSVYGLFQDGSIKIQYERDGRLMWKVAKGKTAEILTPESFDDPESLQQVIDVKPKATRTNTTNAAIADLQAKLDAQAEQNAQLQAMMMQFLQSQTTKV